MFLKIEASDFESIKRLYASENNKIKVIDINQILVMCGKYNGLASHPTIAFHFGMRINVKKSIAR